MKQKIVELLSHHLKLNKKEIDALIEQPRSQHGDYAFPCFSLSKKENKNPAEIAKDIVNKLGSKLPKEISKVEAVNGYVNFFVNKAALADAVINTILKEKEKYGSSNLGKGRKIMVEYSSPNTNKPLHLGHLKNDSIGMALSNILDFSGYEVIRANLFNDRGVHICKAMYAYEKLGKQKKPKTGQKPDSFVGSLYVLFENEARKNLSLNEEVQKMLQKWEKKDKKTRELWKKISGLAEKGIKETYRIFGSKFDVVFKESQFYNKAGDIIKDGLKKKVFEKDSSDAIIAKLDPLPDKVVLRKDGTSVYITNDLALTKYKFEKYSPDECIWITGSEQKLYFQQLFRILFLLGFPWYGKCRHLAYGIVLLLGGKMKSREGKVVDADNIINEMTELAEKEIEKREKVNKEELEKRAKALALGAIKFYLLKIDPAKDVLFEPEKAVSFEGYTGPYLQYAYARASNILKKIKERKIKKSKGKIDCSLLKTKEEAELIRKLFGFEEVVKLAAKQFKPDLIANYAYQLAQLFANFYERCPVINAKDEREKEARVALVKAFRQVLGNALTLLGIKALERM